ALTLAHCEIVNALMVADHGAIGRHQFTGSIRQRFALLGQVGVDKALVISARDEADLLRVRLLRQGQAMAACEFTHLRLIHVSERKARPAELLLRKTEKEVGLILGVVGSAPQEPTIAWLVVLAAGVVSGGEEIGADLPRRQQQLVKLQVIVAEA